MTETYTCLICKRTSSHPEDVKNRYCGYCHRFEGDLSNTTVIGGVVLTNWDVSRMARALIESRQTRSEEEIIQDTIALVPTTYADRRARALEIIADIDEVIKRAVS